MSLLQDSLQHLRLFTSPLPSPPAYRTGFLSLSLFVSIAYPSANSPLTLQPSTITRLSSLYSLTDTQLSSSSQTILSNNPFFYFKQTTHFLVRRFFTHLVFSHTVITLLVDPIVGLVRSNDWSYLLLIQFYTLHLRKPQQQLLLFLIQIPTG